MFSVCWIAGLTEMNSDIYLNGHFETDTRFNLLVDRYMLYYERTPSTMGNKAALVHSRELSTWCLDHGYALDERQKAKKAALQYIDKPPEG